MPSISGNTPTSIRLIRSMLAGLDKIPHAFLNQSQDQPIAFSFDHVSSSTSLTFAPYATVVTSLFDTIDSNLWHHGVHPTTGRVYDTFADHGSDSPTRRKLRTLPLRPFHRSSNCVRLALLSNDRVSLLASNPPTMWHRDSTRCRRLE
jgi:hypothetical protein